MNITHAMRRPSDPRPVVPANSTGVRLVRRFVETGDERCPIAGIWSRFDADSAALDEAEIAVPAMWRLLSWRAFSSAVYTTSPA